ncbi:MAG: M28 family peptidase [Ignavibacteria bacterium]|jgi:subtilisin-like proprotein convertase family protein|nr:M28 family peptidase [Ignavibacteria bacterium]
MKIKIPLFIVISLFVCSAGFSQIIFSSKVDSVKNLVTSESINNFNKELTGEVPVLVGGNTVRIYSRKYNSPMNPVAAQYIYEKLQSYGLNTRYQYNNSTCVNVIAKKTGTKYPNKYFIICAHYDNYCPTPPDTVPGADDNASGVCAVLESARLLANMQFDYTVCFMAFDEEEIGLYGSKAYADTAYFRGDSIMGVLNLDMISYDGNNDSKFSAIVNPQSVDLADDFIAANLLYNIGLVPVKSVNGSSQGSDHWYFWQRGYKAFFGIEDDFNPYYHTVNDKFAAINQPYFTKAVRTSVATFMSWAMGLKVLMNHVQIVSSPDTSARTAILKYSVPFKTGQGLKAPRLYYKINHGVYQYVNAFYTSDDTMKFRIPGQPALTAVSYYFALQDSANTFCFTLPSGGNGFNPPGSAPPQGYYKYYVQSSGNQCAVNLPKTVPDLVIFQDTINVSTTGKVSNVKVNLTVNHPNDGEILLLLKSPNDNQATLSSYNGTGGANYINTTFDDSASVPITQGTPPFTGSYKPQGPLSALVNSDLNGRWILRIYDRTAGNQGTLVNWCIMFRYYNPVSVGENNTELNYGLNQNYPNPFNPQTKIGFSLSKNEFVTLKIYDALGREIQVLVNDNLSSGNYEVIWNAKNFPSGVYYYRIETGSFTETKRMLLVK